MTTKDFVYAVALLFIGWVCGYEAGGKTQAESCESSARPVVPADFSMDGG